MKILQILYFYAPHCSGLTIYAERLGRELVAREHNVTILTSQFHPDLPKSEMSTACESSECRWQ